MEVDEKISFKERIKNLAFKEKVYFLNRREINWSLLAKCGGVALLIGIVGILLLPPSRELDKEFHEQAYNRESPSPSESDPTHETVHQFGAGRGYSSKAPSNLNHLYAPTYGDDRALRTSNDEQTQSMILTRGGLDVKTQLPPGSRIAVSLYERAIVGNHGMPVIGVVTRDYIHENSVAIPQGAKLFGNITFDDSGDRANVTWTSIQLPDGREREISAIGVGMDGKVGILGRTHSEAIKNTIGQTLTRFIGAYAEGSMQRGILGGSPGGNDNGWKNAVSETAKDQAESLASDLKKENRWIEISNNTEFYAVLKASFAFRDPGTTYGR